MLTPLADRQHAKARFQALAWERTASLIFIVFLDLDDRNLIGIRVSKSFSRTSRSRGKGIQHSLYSLAFGESKFMKRLGHEIIADAQYR